MTQKQQSKPQSPDQRQRDEALKARPPQAEPSKEKRQPPANAKKQAEMDDAIDDSFPASDPPSHSSATTLGPSGPKVDEDRKDRRH